mmetsp:Transcript_864/g.2014  ORF Transcript_864/g.2014 Transcript_864/m.2014 type:complete len:116 (+) Transcript_864:775-1122(+)
MTRVGTAWGSNFKALPLSILSDRIKWISFCSDCISSVICDEFRIGEFAELRSKMDTRSLKDEDHLVCAQPTPGWFILPSSGSNNGSTSTKPARGRLSTKYWDKRHCIGPRAITMQ